MAMIFLNWGIQGGHRRSDLLRGGVYILSGGILTSIASVSLDDHFFLARDWHFFVRYKTNRLIVIDALFLLLGVRRRGGFSLAQRYLDDLNSENRPLEMFISEHTYLQVMIDCHML